MCRFWIPVLLAAAALLPATAVHALSPAKSAIVAARTKADADAEARRRAAWRIRNEALVRSTRIEAIAKAKTGYLVRLNVRAEVGRRKEAAEKAARIHRGIIASATGSGDGLAGKAEPRITRHGEHHGHHESALGHRGHMPGLGRSKGSVAVAGSTASGRSR